MIIHCVTCLQSWCPWPEEHGDDTLCYLACRLDASYQTEEHGDNTLCYLACRLDAPDQTKVHGGDNTLCYLARRLDAPDQTEEHGCDITWATLPAVLMLLTRQRNMVAILHELPCLPSWCPWPDRGTWLRYYMSYLACRLDAPDQTEEHGCDITWVTLPAVLMLLTRQRYMVTIIHCVTLPAVLMPLTRQRNMVTIIHCVTLPAVLMPLTRQRNMVTIIHCVTLPTVLMPLTRQRNTTSMEKRQTRAFSQRNVPMSSTPEVTLRSRWLKKQHQGMQQGESAPNIEADKSHWILLLIWQLLCQSLFLKNMHWWIEMKIKWLEEIPEIGFYVYIYFIVAGVLPWLYYLHVIYCRTIALVAKVICCVTNWTEFVKWDSLVPGTG